ncbi:MAG: hypothetical protein ABI679_16460 [Gemmatimonadota bacterium]
MNQDHRRAGNTASDSELGAANWWILLAIAVAVVGMYVWYQRQPAGDNLPQQVKVASADSSGEIPSPDTLRVEPGVPSFTRPGDTTFHPPFIAPSPDFQNPNSKPIGSFLDYARRMQFDPSRGVELALPTDEFGRNPMVRLEPLSNLRRLDSLAFAEGRIIARVRSDAPRADLSLHNGENFIWVRGQLGAPMRAEIWSTSVLATPKTLPLSYSPRPPPDAPAGKDAFWSGGDNSRALWIICGRGWCHS